jgi:hypothetical protein
MRAFWVRQSAPPTGHRPQASAIAALQAVELGGRKRHSIGIAHGRAVTQRFAQCIEPGPVVLQRLSRCLHGIVGVHAVWLLGPMISRTSAGGLSVTDPVSGEMVLKLPTIKTTTKKIRSRKRRSKAVRRKKRR